MTTGPGTGRLSTSEAFRALVELLTAQAQRPAQPPEHSVSVTRNAKGDVQWEVVVRGPDPFAAEQDAREIHDRLVRAYPHSSLLDELKPMLEASVAEQKADPAKVAAKAAAIARRTA